MIHIEDTDSLKGTRSDIPLQAVPSSESLGRFKPRPIGLLHQPQGRYTGPATALGPVKGTNPARLAPFARGLGTDAPAPLGLAGSPQADPPELSQPYVKRVS